MWQNVSCLCPLVQKQLAAVHFTSELLLPDLACFWADCILATHSADVSQINVLSSEMSGFCVFPIPQECSNTQQHALKVFQGHAAKGGTGTEVDVADNTKFLSTRFCLLNKQACSALQCIATKVNIRN